MGQITLQGVRKSFGPVNIIKDANLDIEDGSFVVFVGPSGCGKTTLLRLIAGLEDVTGGQILIDGNNVVDVPPAKRGLSMVFQSYALYPHMSVRGNIAFGLKMAGLPRAEIDRKVEAAAATLNLTPYLDRKPRELSGGQRQRVAIGRAIVREPKAFLFDEPLSNLDAALRVQMRMEVTKLQKQLATTAIYVTHDQVEAMTMADKIVVLNAGQHRAIRLAAGTVRAAGQPVRRRLHRLAEDEFRAGRGGRASTAPPPSASGPSICKIGQEGGRLAGDRVGRRASRQRHVPLCRCREARHADRARYIGELDLKAGDRVWLSPDPARLHRFDKDGEAMRSEACSRPARARCGQHQCKRRRSMKTEQRCIWKNSNWIGRVAVVTGGGQGIGLACAEALAEAGAKVIIADRDPKVAETGCASLKAKGYWTPRSSSWT